MPPTRKPVQSKRPDTKPVAPPTRIGVEKGWVPTDADRVAIEGVAPQIDHGRWPAKSIVGDVIEISADIFCDGHDEIAAEILHRASGDEGWTRVPMQPVGYDRWSGRFRLDRVGSYFFTIEAWRDPYSSWRSEVLKKRDAGQTVDLEMLEGAAILDQALSLADGSAKAGLMELHSAITGTAVEEAWSRLGSPKALAAMRESGPRLNVSRYPSELPLKVDRRRARFSAWYELFPRSASNDPNRHGTFDDVIARLPYVRELGFDVLYLPPIHPIGTTNRKGKNNTLIPAPGDPGSVYAIGSDEGGHDAIHPELGTLEDFKRLVGAADEHGLEIALDFAIQSSPDHPWIKQHPGWFDWRPDGTLKFAENPPKKYEDIVNFHFYRDALPGLWHALRDVVLFWMDAGVRIFRVDNPHTKPLPFWEWLIAEVHRKDPEVLFLAEAFTHPKMMRRLAKIGFQQSYTYFTWRNAKAELTEYAIELSGNMADYYRPNFFTNTPDINPPFLQSSGRAGFVVRSTLAATLSSNWGIYNGFELCEAEALPASDEYLNSEKYELRARDFDAPGNIRHHIVALNRIRRENLALQNIRDTLFPNAWNDQILSYLRATPDRSNAILILVNLDPHNAQAAEYEVPLWEFGLGDDAAIKVEDLLLGIDFTLTGKVQQITLDPAERSVVIWRLSK